MASTQTGGSAADQAKERAQQATEQAKDKAQEAGQQAKGRVRDEVDRRSTEIGEQATSVADAIRQASQQLRDQGKEPAAKPLEQAAQRMESAGQWLRDSDGDTILRDAEDFGRRKPLVVAAGGIAIGFALSRLLKASSSNRYRGRSQGSGGLPAAPPATTGVTGTVPERTTTPPPTPPAGTMTPGATTTPSGPGATQPQPTTTPPREGIAVPDLPEPEPGTRNF
jgi:hypothetical protein